jgi:hypothetical protein
MSPVGDYGELVLEMEHGGISQFRKDGKSYWFNHMSPKLKHPHFWRTKIDAMNSLEVTDPETEQNSAAISSLLSSILNNNTENIMLFSRPSVWSDITLSKQVITQGGNDIVIDSLVLELQYDYTRRTGDYSNIDISANEELMPYIACSVEDLNHRSDGRSPLHRSYRKSSQSVTFTATEKYETYHFVNWTDRTGKVVSANPILTINRQTDQTYTANYERRVPVLNVPTTIKVGNNGGTYTVQVANSGSGDIEMDWYVSDSLSTWVHLNGDAEGIDNGCFTFTFDANNAGSNRIDSLEIFAPETDEMFKKIYIVQEIDMSQYPNILYIDDHDVFPGQRFEIPIKLKNEVDVAGVSMTLKLPAGMTLAKDGNGDAIYSLNGERAKNNKFSVYWAENQDGGIGFRIMSPTTTTISGTDGVLLKVAVDIASNIAKGEYELILTSNSLTVNNGENQLSTLDLPKTHSTLSVVDGMLGDVNADSRIDLTDAIMIVYHSLGVQQKGFIGKVADVNGDGRIDLTDAIVIVYKSLGIEPRNAPRLNDVEPE